MSEQAGQYLDWVEGDQVAYITGIKHAGASPGAKGHATLNIASKPTSEDYNAPFTTLKLTFPLAHDDQRTKIMLDSQVKRILFVLAEVPADMKEVVKIRDVIATIQKNLSQVDFKCEFTMKDGKPYMNKKTGQMVTPKNCVAFKPLEAIAKKPYESGIDYDFSDLPF